MKHFLVLLPLFLLLSCKETKKVEAMPEAEVAAVVADPRPVAPYNAIMVRHKVKGFASWYASFKDHEPMRKENGLSYPYVGQEKGDSNLVTIILAASDLAKAKEFSANPALKEAMEKGGVLGKPEIKFINVVRLDTNQIDNQARVFVTHKVKDYDAWLAGYDAETSAVRASYGLIDRALSRDVDDPSMVTLVFAISDETKAMARMNSPELKKLMEKVGVVGKPEIHFLSWVK
jgi:quinol monooxygenase YgiN